MSGPGARLSEAVAGRLPPGAARPLIGLLPGEGVGPELTACARELLAALEPTLPEPPEIREGPGGRTACDGGALTAEADRFCAAVFAAGGAVLAGPHGGRWVYELRARFDLFCKLSPLRAALGVPDGRDFDVIVVREQGAGIYQGRWSEGDDRREGHVAEHTFSYSRREVNRILAVGAELAAARRGRLTVAVKDGGIPSVSRLWRLAADSLRTEDGSLAVEVLDIDYLAYLLVREPERLDVIVAPNLFGDVLSDLGGALLGGRGLCFGASFDAGRAAVYQTNHGAAYDLAGSGRANPVAHLLALAMLLRESFALHDAAAAIEAAIGGLLSEGVRTADLPGERGPLGCGEFTAAVCERLAATAAPARR